jgi:hypothetical protein
VVFHGENEANLKSASGGDRGSNRDKFGCEVLGLDWTRAAIADDRKLGVRGRVEEESTDTARWRTIFIQTRL